MVESKASTTGLSADAWLRKTPGNGRSLRCYAGRRLLRLCAAAADMAAAAHNRTSEGAPEEVVMPTEGGRTSEGSAPGRNRTCDLALRRRALYPLSYGRGGA
jgi:hypothetical protein